MQDPVVISREQLSLREKELKAKLFGTAVNGHQPLIPLPDTYVEENDKKKARWHEAQKQPSEYLY